MPEELTNLLPESRQRALARDYRLRLSVVSIWFVTVLTFIAGLLLVPAFIYLSASASAKETQLNALASSSASPDAYALTSRLGALSVAAVTLKALANVPSPTSAVRSILGVPRPGIVLSGFTYTPPPSGKGGTLVVSGTALTRDALRNYEQQLQSEPFIASAALPVSAYAKDSDIGFSITVTLRP